MQIKCLFWHYLLKKMYSTCGETHPSSYKDIQQRMTVLTCANAAGNHKWKLVMIGKSRNSRVLKNVKVIYKSNKCAWVNGELFKDWLESHFAPKTMHCHSARLPKKAKFCS